MAISGLPFDDIRSLFERLPAPDTAAGETVRSALHAGEAGSLGRLEEMAAWLAAWSGRNPPRVMRPLMALFAGTHGVSYRLGTPDPVGATMARVERIAAGGAPVSQLCTAHDLSLKVFDLALDVPTDDLTVQPAFDERGAAATIAFGMEAIAGGTDLLCVGDVGADNAVPASAVLCALHPDDFDAPRSGEKVREAVTKALAIHKEHLSDPLEVLRRLGGRELAAIAGAILAARTEKIPVILDGLPALAAAAVLHAAHEGATAHCVLAGPQGMAGIAGKLGVAVLPDFGIEAGEGTAAALSAGFAKAAAQVAEGMTMAGTDPRPNA